MERTFAWRATRLGPWLYALALAATLVPLFFEPYMTRSALGLVILSVAERLDSHRFQLIRVDSRGIALLSGPEYGKRCNLWHLAPWETPSVTVTDARMILVSPLGLRRRLARKVPLFGEWESWDDLAALVSANPAAGARPA